MVNALFVSMLASLDSTTAALSMVFHYLSGHPETQDLVVAEPERIPAVVQELIRHEPVSSTGRVLTGTWNGTASPCARATGCCWPGACPGWTRRSSTTPRGRLRAGVHPPARLRRGPAPLPGHARGAPHHPDRRRGVAHPAAPLPAGAGQRPHPALLAHPRPVRPQPGLRLTPPHPTTEGTHG
ncbi:hypothetical protein NKH77_47205 [Streptomyces sp. M19]